MPNIYCFMTFEKLVLLSFYMFRNFICFTVCRLFLTSIFHLFHGFHIYIFPIIVFPPHKIVGLPNCAHEHDSSSLLDFLLRGSLGETAVVIIVVIVGPLIH